MYVFAQNDNFETAGALTFWRWCYWNITTTIHSGDFMHYSIVKNNININHQIAMYRLINQSTIEYKIFNYFKCWLCKFTNDIGS